MSERQMFDLLAHDAPEARPDLADTVIDRARHNRVRRWAVSGACAAVALIAAVPLTVALNNSAQLTHRSTPGAGVIDTHSADAAVSDESRAYAAAVTYLSQQLVHGAHWQVVYVLDHICTNTVSRTAACTARPISADLRHDLIAALRDYAPVRFVSDDAKIRNKDLDVLNGGVAVTLGSVELTGDTARVALSVQCGGLCGLGQTLTLAKQHGVWTVTGSTGPGWIS